MVFDESGGRAHCQPADECCPPGCCDMRGMLSFMIMWILSKGEMSKGEMYGQQIAEELAKRRGEKPNPGTLYPALKDLEANNMVSSRTEGRRRFYSLTTEGEKELETACTYFCKVFGEIVREHKKT